MAVFICVLVNMFTQLYDKSILVFFLYNRTTIQKANTF